MEQDRVSQLWDEVQRLNARVLELEQALGERRAEAPRPPPQPAPTVQAVAPPPPQQPPPVQEVPQAPPPPRPAPAPAGAGGLEAEIGGNWLNKIGAVALVLGMAFFLKYAIDNRWINETGRITIGLIVGLACLFGGEHFQKRNLNRYAQGISGAGIAILYFSIYAAFGFYSLIPQLPAFGFMILVTITAIAISVRYDAITIAVLGIIGGFMTPVLMQKPGGGGGDSEIQLFTYIAILDLGILGATYYKNWRSLNMLSLAGTAVVFTGWWGDSYEPKKLGVTLVFLTIFYAIFAAQSFVQNVVARRRMNSADLMMVILTPVLYFWTSYALLRGNYHLYLGIFAAAVGAVYVIFSHRVQIVGYEDRKLRLLFLMIASGFLIVAVPIQLEQHWVTIGWVAEGAVIAGLGFYMSSARTRYVGFGILCLAAFRLLFLDSWGYGLDRQIVPFFNARFATYLFSIAVIAFVAWLYSRYREQITDSEKAVQVILALGANFLMIWILSIEVLAWLVCGTAYVPGSVQFFALSAVWAFYAAIMLAVGIAIRYRPARIMAMIVLGIVILKSFLLDVWTLEKLYRIIAFLGLGVLLLLASYFYQAQRDRVRQIIGAEGETDAS
ncbi:MAG: DUF2339 domain-containing protein [Armatimonadetes bacterium]|nr:DUF2339 domain-containing protein [Armatimonadota bacterium]